MGLKPIATKSRYELYNLNIPIAIGAISSGISSRISSEHGLSLTVLWCSIFHRP